MNVLRDAMTVDSLDSCGVYFGTTGGQVYGSTDAGDNVECDRARSAGGLVGRGADAAMIRVVLPHHLRTLARVGDEVQVGAERNGHAARVLDALEAKYPMLRGTIRDHTTQARRPLVRFFACEEDVSHESADQPLPEAVATGAEPFFIMGAIAGG